MLINTNLDKRMSKKMKRKNHEQKEKKRCATFEKDIFVFGS